MPSQPLHEDFGEKIGGAKKDLWSARGLYSADLDDMNEREADKYVRKDNVWKKPDYQAMLNDGVPIGIVYYIKKVRDAVPASPRYYRAYNYEEKIYQQKRYIDTVRQLQKVMEKVRTVEDAKIVFVDFYIRNAYLRPVREWNGQTAYERTSDYSHNPALTDNLRNIIKISSDVQFEYDFVRKAKSEQFLVPKEQKVPRGYDIHLYDGNFDYRQSQQKTDFINRYYHKKTKHPIVSLEVFQEDYKKNHDGAEWDKADDSIDLEGDTAAKVDIERFMEALSEKDRQILELRVEGYTYQEIADKVGYKTHSAVKKRIDKIGRKFQGHTNTDIGFE